MSEMELYDKIFQVADENMKKGERTFSFSKVALDCILCREPQRIHVDEFIHLDSRAYIEALYVRCLNGLPNEMAHSKMEELLAIPGRGELYAKYIFLVYIVYSAEFKSMNRKMAGMKELRKKVISNSSLSGRLYIIRKEISAKVRGFVKKYLFVPVWKIMPDSIKRKVRKLRNRESV